MAKAPAKKTEEKKVAPAPAKAPGFKEVFNPDNLVLYPPKVAVYTCKDLEECSKEGFFLQRGSRSPVDFGLKKGVVVILSDGNESRNVVVR